MYILYTRVVQCIIILSKREPQQRAYIIRLRELIAIYTPDIIRPNSTQYNNNKYIRTR